LGPSIEPEKPSPKSASTANPPPKWHFYGDFINYRVNCCRYSINLSRPNLIIMALWIFWSLELFTLGKNQTVFLFIWYNDVLLMGTPVVGNLSTSLTNWQTGKAPQTRDLWAESKDASIRIP
jgi:hypothetical protein